MSGLRQNGQADLWLVIFLAVLLAQSAFSLFAPAPVDGSGGIDVIVRTSAAAIFGYFLSSGAPPAGRLRIRDVSCTGLFCLLTLLALRAAAVSRPWLLGSDSATATVAQLRDLVSGCVGFLIGSPGGGQSNQNQL